MTLQSGTRIATYEIIAPIGAGGMGEVYRARDTKLARDVAVKVLPDSFANDADWVARFEREAQAIAALSHPNILAVHDFGNAEGTVYTVMELLEGATLRERLDGGALPLRKVLDYAAQIARGLAAAHDKDITHRDLKPENLFITNEGRVKILDFGLAKITEDDTTDLGEAESAPTRAAGTEAGVVLGTVGYMSPEQVRGQRADHRSDIFSFGAVLYEMLSGRRAFRRETSAESMTAILKEEPPEPSGLATAIPAALGRILRRCLEKTRGERFQSAQDLAFALESISGDSGSSLASVGRSPPSLSKPLLFGALALVLVLVGAAFYLGTTAKGGNDTGSIPTYDRLTFRRGTVVSARFVPGGRDIIYDAAWDGEALETYSTLPGSSISREVGLTGGQVQAVSPTGEIVSLNLGRRSLEMAAMPGTLVVSSLGGGSSRPIMENVAAADSLAERSSIAVVRLIDGRRVVEYPAGSVVYQTSNYVDGFRLSPDGDHIALGEKVPGFGGFWRITFVDRLGETRSYTTELLGDNLDLAWSADGREVWFNTVLGASPHLYAMSREGEQRVLARPPIKLRILDVAENGDALVARTSLRFGVFGVAPGETEERDYSWLDSTEVDGTSSDGRTLLLTEFGEGGGVNEWSVYLRNVDGSPAVRLGSGQGFALSPDGSHALALKSGESPALVLLPTGPGNPHELPNSSIADFIIASFTRDGEHVVFAGSETGGLPRFYRQAISGGGLEAISPELPRIGLNVGAALGSQPASPDGRAIAAWGDDGRVTIFPVDGSDPQPFDGTDDRWRVLRWSDDSRFLFAYVFADKVAKIYRFEVSSGDSTLWKTIAPHDPAGIVNIYAIQIGDDGDFYYYTIYRNLSDLYLVKGLR